MKVAPSVLNADFPQKGKWLKELEEAGADRIHWDIMDNKYVPNTGVAVEKVAELREDTKLFFESHLMVQKPESYVKRFADMGNNLLTFHPETAKKPMELLKEISDYGMKTGICINNRVSAKKAIPFLGKVDLALVMSVEAGFGGQEFNEKALEKIDFLRKNIESKGFYCEIEVDGGINNETGAKAAAHGAQVLVAGSYVFRHPKGPAFAVKELKKL